MPGLYGQDAGLGANAVVEAFRQAESVGKLWYQRSFYLINRRLRLSSRHSIRAGIIERVNGGLV